jgi:hypothetical protein
MIDRCFFDVISWCPPARVADLHRSIADPSVGRADDTKETPGDGGRGENVHTPVLEARRETRGGRRLVPGGRRSSAHPPSALGSEATA